MPKITVSYARKSRLSEVKISRFRGVDLSSPPAHVDSSRSPDAPNMMPDFSGKPVKRPGYAEFQEYGAKIYGVFLLNLSSGTKRVVHAGTGLYLDNPEHPLASDMNEAYSAAVQFGEKLWIFDRAHYRVLGYFENPDYNAGNPASEPTIWQLREAADFAYEPTVTISRDPDGGGTPYEPFNLIGTRFTDSFLATATATVYQLSYDGIEGGSAVVRKLGASSTAKNKVWVTLTEGTDYTVDTALGQITFASAPGVSPVTGEDNVVVSAGKTIPEYAAMIADCRVCTLFGAEGAENRVFAAGNPDYPERDWYSQMDNPAYFGETWYADLGAGSSRIMGYSHVGNLLAVHRENAEGNGNVILRTGEISEGEAVFPVTNILKGPGAVCTRGFGSLGGEPLFLTGEGIYALTEKDATGEKYAERRSFYIDKALTAAGNLAGACASVWRNFFLLSVGTRLYLLDGSQRDYASGEPYSNYQYECYYWENIPATVVWAEGDGLFFGGADGRVFRFDLADADDGTDGYYKDCGAAIEAHWDLPAPAGNDFYADKALCYLAVQLEPHPRTSVKVEAKVRGVWKTVWQQSAVFRYFKWSALSWPAFSWQSDDGARTFGRKRLLPRLDKISIRIGNAVAGEPFGLYAVGLEYTESGKLNT